MIKMEPNYNNELQWIFLHTHSQDNYLYLSHGHALLSYFLAFLFRGSLAALSSYWPFC